MNRENKARKKARSSSRGNIGVLQRFKSANKATQITTIAGISTLAILLLLYLGFSIYFMNHFYFGTKINNTVCSGMSAKAAREAILNNIDSYTLTIEEAYDKTEEINGDDINMNAEIKTDISSLKKKQNGFAWPACIFKKYTYDADVNLNYDVSKLDSIISGLDCMRDENMKEPLNAKIEYNESDKKYEIIADQPGTFIDRDVVSAAIAKAIDDLQTTFDMREEGCYQEPEITADSDVIVSALDKLNSYSDSVVTYNILDNKETVNFSIFHDWISWNEKFEISFDSSAARKVVAEWAKKYNTSGKPKTLDTSYGKQVTITAGNYGWKINIDDTTAELIDAIKTGDSLEKEPVFQIKAANKGDSARDYGNSYVEINLATQHLFMYVNGSLIVETDFVSGRVTNGNATPVGIYPVTYKQSPAVLRGANYASPVTYWMPFNGGVGLHDATWRNKFGGNIYYNSGSHGCINLPLSAAKTIYQNITAGMPVIVYDEKIDNLTPAPVATLTPEEQLAAEMESSVDGSTPVDTDQAQTVDVSDGNTSPATPAPTKAPVKTAAPTRTPVRTKAPTRTPARTTAPVRTPNRTPTPTVAPTTVAPTPTDIVTTPPYEDDITDEQY